MDSLTHLHTLAIPLWIDWNVPFQGVPITPLQMVIDWPPGVHLLSDQMVKLLAVCSSFVDYKMHWSEHWGDVTLKSSDEQFWQAVNVMEIMLTSFNVIKKLSALASSCI